MNIDTFKIKEMYYRLFACLLALAALSSAVDQKQSHQRREVENNLRMVNLDPNDSEQLRIESSGGGKKSGKPTKDDKPKTLSQQIADGKYGLIQKELFSNKPQKRPGILSYEDNPEVTNDNIDNLGGLDKNEIWLAENHLLVLRGGKFPPYDDKKINAESPWPTLDDYKAPLHQVKIPKHPKVPPPFPVQLTEDGPLQILGTNFSRTLNETEQSKAFAVPPPEGYDPSSFYPYDTNSSDPSPWSAPVQVPFNPSGEYAPGEPLFPPQLLNGTLPPSLGYLPPGAVVLPPPRNQTDELYDYDDPSIYYPPPYSFYYPKDNSSAVPAGPLVPGIVLPPPPNFFAALEETTTTEPVTKARKPSRTRKPTITTPLPTTTMTTTTTTEGTTRKPIRIYPTSNYYNNEIKPTVTTTTEPPSPMTVLPPRPDNRYLPVPRKPTVTKLRPVNPPKQYSNKPFQQYKPTVPSRAPFVTTTQVPLKYFTTSNDIRTNSVTQESGEYTGTRDGKSAKQRPTPTQYFYYEETEKPTTRRPARPIYVDTTKEYYLRPKPVPTVRQRRPQYVYVTARPYNTQKPRFRFIQQPVKQPDTFNIHIAKLQNQIRYYSTQKTTLRPSPKPVYQFSFQSQNYQAPRQNVFKPAPQEDFGPGVPKYSVEIQQAIEITPTQRPAYEDRRPIFYEDEYRPTTEPPRNYYTTSRPEVNYETVTQQAKYVGTPRPVSPFHFEVTPNPIFRGFYTKPDEGYVDDRTKTYFTMFGRKLPSTTPIPSEEYQQYRQKPISLEGDTLVNYLNPRPTINPDAEIISIDNAPPRYPNVVRYPARQQDNSPNPEIIKAIPVEVESTKSEDGSFISYQLPGDNGAHFYFLTPQLAQSRDQGAGFYYSSRPQRSRIRRNEKTIDKER
ncbi:uncharacterized protein isoform X1 [Leptinotarsa decemlineata]|uniref:uncharacterized protein isoform X1 n=1 Tax=Leptinotarsa decemlineata TaxID=7539 RepID=UPI003D3051F0